MTQASDQRANRKRFSFGPVWAKAVVEGTVKDQEKLIAHGLKLKVGTRSALKQLKFETLLAKVADAIKNAPPEEAETAKAEKTSTKKVDQAESEAVAA